MTNGCDAVAVGGQEQAEDEALKSSCMQTDRIDVIVDERRVCE